MFFCLMCIGLYALIASNMAVDTYGWLWLVAGGWFLGFLDGRFSFGKGVFGKKEASNGHHPDSTMPPDEHDVTPINQ